MSVQQLFEVAGVDGCRAVWFVVIASATKTSRAGRRYALKFKDSCVARNFAEVLSETRDCRIDLGDFELMALHWLEEH